MFKHIIAALFALVTTVAMAATLDANKATQAELEGLKGVGPAMAGKILDERKKGPFKSWDDMVERVKGIGEGNAAKLSAEGLTVGGASFKGAPAAAAKKDDKPAATTAAKKDDKPMAAAPAAPAVAAAPAAAKAEVKKDAPAADKAKATDKPKAADAAASGAKK
jgi:competence protein ComEA